jgi:hypothetical protein
MLFFAISLTDDLRLDITLIDECSTGRRHSSIWTSPHDPSHKGHVVTESGAAFLPRFASRESLSRIAGVTPTPDASVLFAEFNRFSGRAPPFISL